jgi:CHAT domain-containing protein
MVLRALPATRGEIEQIVAVWRAITGESAKAYFGSDASEERFKAEAPGHRVIHLATHGYSLEGDHGADLLARTLDVEMGYLGENPLLLSGLFFAGANRHGKEADRVGAEDGVLTAFEVSAMDLAGTALVVLSACETGLGRVEDGEGVYGLRRAFQMAGVRTVISALWPVSDVVTAEMMGDLYRRGGGTLPQQLRSLQLRRIRALRDRGQTDHPISWGAFIALGDWR